MKTLSEIFAEIKPEEINAPEDLFAAVKKHGGEYTDEEIIAYVKDKTGRTELDDDALDQIAGGMDIIARIRHFIGW